MENKSAKYIIDTSAGSRSFNRFDMQVSQVLHMAIELYDNLNYLFILDHYDDITLFDLEAEPLVVSYYQMKTSDEMITIDLPAIIALRLPNTSAITPDGISQFMLTM